MSSAAQSSIAIGDSAQAQSQKMCVLGVDLENPLQPENGGFYTDAILEAQFVDSNTCNVLWKSTTKQFLYTAGIHDDIGSVIFRNLPTSDSAVEGQVWNS